MDSVPLALRCLLAVFVLAAGIIDFRSRKIPNWLTLPAFVAGIAGNLVLSGVPGLAAAGKGIGLAALVSFPLYAIGGVGGGDVKLMLASGAILGPGPFLLLFAFNTILGGVAAIGVAIARGRLGRTLVNTARIVRDLALFRSPRRSDPSLDIAHSDALTMPRGAIFAVAAAILLFLSS